MKINNNKFKEAQEKALKILEEKENKAEAICEAMEEIISVRNEEIINELKAQAESINEQESEKDYCKRLGLRVLSKEEKEFFEALRADPKQSIEGKQIDMLPNTFIDITLEDVKTESELLQNFNFAPADVKKWISASKTGGFSWTGLTDELKGELKASFKVIDMEVGKLTVFLILPKSIKDLALPFVEKYCREVLKEQLKDGLEYGSLVGTGVDMPIGIYKQIAKVDSETQEHKDKEVNTTITSFSPKSLAPAKLYLNKNGKRIIKKLVLVCNPADKANYIDPAMFDAEGRNVSSDKNIKVCESSNNPQGKAALFIPKKYLIGVTGLKIASFDQTLADQDADLIVGKGYSNGRASDDNVAFVFDPTKLQEYIQKVSVVGTVNTSVEGTVNTKEVVQGA